MVEQITKTELITILKIADVPGRNGPQREITMDVPWSLYESKFWLDAERPPFPKLGDHLYVKFTRGRLKKEESDPSLDYNYNWFITNYDVEAPEFTEEVGEAQPSNGAFALAQSRPATSQRPSVPAKNDRERSIERQVAFKVVGDMILGDRIKPHEAHIWTEYFASCIAGDVQIPEIVKEAIASDPDTTVSEIVQEVVGTLFDEVPAKAEEADTEVLFCERHETVFELQVSPSGTKRWAHQKADESWCMYDGLEPQAQETS